MRKTNTKYVALFRAGWECHPETEAAGDALGSMLPAGQSLNIAATIHHRFELSKLPDAKLLCYLNQAINRLKQVRWCKQSIQQTALAMATWQASKVANREKSSSGGEERCFHRKLYWVQPMQGDCRQDLQVTQRLVEWLVYNKGDRATTECCRLLDKFSFFNKMRFTEPLD